MKSKLAEVFKPKPPKDISVKPIKKTPKFMKMAKNFKKKKTYTYEG